MDIKNDIKNIEPIDADLYKKTYSENMISVEAIRLYNSALEALKRDSEDIAVIELKKALSYNENFIEALTLIGYSYLVAGNKTDAKKHLLKAAELGEYGIRAYMLLHSAGVFDIYGGNNNKSEKRSGEMQGKKDISVSRAKESDAPAVSIHAMKYSANKGVFKKTIIFLGIIALILIIYFLFYS